jgi:hypothetical protein
VRGLRAQGLTKASPFLSTLNLFKIEGATGSVATFDGFLLFTNNTK